MCRKFHRLFIMIWDTDRRLNMWRIHSNREILNSWMTIDRLTSEMWKMYMVVHSFISNSITYCQFVLIGGHVLLHNLIEGFIHTLKMFSVKLLCLPHIIDIIIAAECGFCSVQLHFSQHNKFCDTFWSSPSLFQSVVPPKFLGYFYMISVSSFSIIKIVHIQIQRT